MVKAFEKGEALHAEMLNTAKNKLAGFNLLKGEIDTDMAKAHEVLDGVRRKIRANILSKENPDGLLTNSQEDYLQCLAMNYRHLEQMFRKDEAVWIKNIELRRKEANEVKKRLQAFLSK